MLFNFIINRTNSFNLIENIVGVTTIISFSALIIQSFYQYYISFRFYTYYNVPTKYFSKIRKRDFFESTFLIFSFLLLFFVASKIIFNSLLYSEEICKINFFSKEILHDLFFNFIAIAFIRFPSFLYTIIVDEDLNENFINSKVPQKKLMGFLIVNFIILVLFSLRYLCKKLIYLYIIVYFIFIIIFFRRAFFISLGNSNLRLNKEFEIFRVGVNKYASINDYGDSVLALKVKIVDEKIFLYLDKYFILSKNGKSFENIVFKDVIRIKNRKEIIEDNKNEKSISEIKNLIKRLCCKMKCDTNKK